jgi:hypothetical protein
VTYIMNMASGNPYVDDDVVQPGRCVAQAHSPESVANPETARLQLVVQHPTCTDPNAAALAAGLDIASLIKTLDD